MTGVIGGSNSTLGSIQVGHHRTDIVVVYWMGSSKVTDGTSEFIFGTSEGGKPITLVKNQPTVLTRDQARQARSLGAQLLVIGTGV